MTDLAVLFRRCGYDAIDVDRRHRTAPLPNSSHESGAGTDPHLSTSEPGAFELVTQGGGHPSGHRCPGESIALGLLIETARVLAATEYDVVSPREPDRSRIPTLPPGGLVLDRVRVPARH